MFARTSEGKSLQTLRLAAHHAYLECTPHASHHTSNARSSARYSKSSNMGKARRKKTHGNAARATADSGTAVSAYETQPPFANKSTTDEASMGNMDMKAGVLEGVTSLNALTRESSCAAIASLFEKIDSTEAGNEAWSAAQRLIAGGLVKKLLPRLVDRVVEVQVQATGAMRNVSAVRDPRVCEIMVQDDCLTPVLTLLDRMSTAAVASTATDGNSTNSTCSPTPPVNSGSSRHSGVRHDLYKTAKEQEQMVMAQLVATLCNLLAAVDVAVGRFTNQGGLQVMMRLLLAEGCRGSADVFGGALQALHVATDSNPELVRQLTAMPGAVDQLSLLVTGADVEYVQVSTSMRLQAAGIIVNSAGSSLEARTGHSQADLGRLVLPLVLEQMSYDPTALDRVCSALATAKNMAGSDADGAGEKMDVDGDITASGGDAAPECAAQAAAFAATRPMQIVTKEAVLCDAGVAEGGKKNGRFSDRTTHETVALSKGEGGEGDDSMVGEDGEATTSSVEQQPDKDAELRWEWQITVAEPLKLAAEVMTNLCALAAAEGGGLGDDREEEWGSDDEDAMEQAAIGAGGVSEVRRNSEDEASGCAELLDALVDGGAMQRTVTALGALLAPTPRDRFGAKVEAGAETHDENRLVLPCGTAGDLADLRATVALCAANLVQNLPAKALGADPHKLWSELCGMCEAATQRAPSCVETLSGVMWGLVQRAGSAVAGGIQMYAAATAAAAEARGEMVGTSLPPLLLKLSDPEATRSFEARVNAVGMIGVLGSGVAEISTSAAVGGSGEVLGGDIELGSLLVRAIEDPHVLVQAEALNAVMDYFGGDGRDAAFQMCGAPAALAAGVPAFRRKVQKEGKAFGRDALCHLKETALNAVRFVKYKQATDGAKGSSKPSR